MRKFCLPPSWIWIPILCLIFGMLISACGPSTTKKPQTKPPRYEQVEKFQCLQILRTNNIGIIPGILTKDFSVGGIVVGDWLSAANYVMADSYYIIVEEEWFKKEILPGFQDFIFKNGIENYSKLRNDCDDFSRAFSFYVRVKFRTMGFLKATPAIGDVYYNFYDPDADENVLVSGHAINGGIFLDKNGKVVVRFIEPQGLVPSFVELDPIIKSTGISFFGM